MGVNGGDKSTWKGLAIEEQKATAMENLITMADIELFKYRLWNGDHNEENISFYI